MGYSNLNSYKNLKSPREFVSLKDWGGKDYKKSGKTKWELINQAIQEGWSRLKIQGSTASILQTPRGDVSTKWVPRWHSVLGEPTLRYPHFLDAALHPENIDRTQDEVEEKKKKKQLERAKRHSYKERLQPRT